MQDILPTGLSFVGAIASAGTYTSSTGQWILGTIPNQNSAQLEIQARVTDVNAVVDLAQVMKADQEDIDSTPGNGIESEDDQDSVSLTPQQADLDLSKTVDNARTKVGQNVAYTIVVSNQGPNAATNVEVMDQLPEGMTYRSGVVPQGTYNAGSGVWSVGTIAVGSQASLTIVASVDQPGTKTNMAQVSAADQYDPDSTPGNGIESEDDQQSVTITPPVIDVDLTKRIDIARPILGQSIRYTVVVSNAGPDDATNLVVKDDLPDGLIFAGSEASSGNYNLNSGEWSVGSLASGATATLMIDAEVDTIKATTNTAQVRTVEQYDSASTPGTSVPTQDD